MLISKPGQGAELRFSGSAVGWTLLLTAWILIAIPARSDAANVAGTNVESGGIFGGSILGGRLPQSGVPEGQDLLTSRVQRFLKHLRALRTGDRKAEQPLLDVARELCEQHSRCDTLNVAHYYTALSNSELQRGLEYEDRYRELFSAVNDARRRGLKREAWLEERARILIQLTVLAAESGADADHAPAGRALSLSALLRAQSLERRADSDSLSFQHELSAGHNEVERCLAILKDVGQESPQLEALWVRGRLLRLSGREAAARTSFEHCLTQSNRFGYDSFSERALIELLRLARERGDLHAREQLLERLSQLRRPEECWPLVREFADLMFQKDRAAEAQAILLRYPPSDEADSSDWHTYVGNMALRTGDESLAEKEALWLENNEASSRAMLARAQWLLVRKQPEDVILELGGGALEIDFEPRAEAIGRSLLGEAYARLGDWRAASTQFSRSLALAEVYRSRLSQNDHNVFGEWIGLHTITLAALVQARLNQPLQAALIVENFQSRSLRDVRSGRIARQTEMLSVDSLLGWADAYELGWMSWAIGADFGIAVHVSPARIDMEPAWAQRVNRGRRELNGAARRLREAVADDGREQVLSLAQEVSTALFPEALRDRLRRLAQGLTNPRLLVLVHGPIESVPIELLLEAGNGLGISIVPVVMPGLPEEVRSIGAPDFSSLGGWTLASSSTGEALPALPAADAEIEELLQLIPGAKRANPGRATETVEHALKLGLPMHLATHLTWGCDCTDTRLAPLALQLGSGAALCSHRVAELAPNSPLVVLSACETAEGRFVDAEGLQGLTRAFLESGTRNLLVTLWPVADRSAKRIALDFHRALLRGEWPSVAAAEARASARQDGIPPADWAAFRLIGID